MIIKGKVKDYVKTVKNDVIISIIASANQIDEEEINTIQERNFDVKIDISRWRDKRSLSANAYAWVLMDKIAEKLNTFKEDVYREIIKKVGVFEILPIKEIAVDSFIRRWQSKGLGWVCDNLGACKSLKGFYNIVAYYGTSTYDKKEMARFIDCIIEDAKELGIETKTPNEIAEMKSLWENEV
jgi:hypothetical protein